jgi:cytochrome oxidase assembly protein ShyY1
MKAMAVGFRFDPEWRITLFTLVMVPTMIGLGFWQLDRAEEKQRLAEAWERQQARPAAPVEALLDREPAALAYRQATATGRFREGEYLLLDNRVHRGKFGYEVLGIMDLERVDMAVLVNRGWVAGDPARLSLPAVPPVTGTQTVAGHVYVPPGEPYLLAEQQLSEGWPKVIQALEISEITPAVGAGGVFPHVLRLDQESPAALTVDWRVVNVQPDKHTGYAVQWFAMAAVLAVFYILRSSNLWQLLTAGRIGSE